MSNISLVVEPELTDHVHGRRFRWCLTTAGEPDLASTENFATRREAVQAGEIALRRALERGSIRPAVRGRYPSPDRLAPVK